WWSEHVGVKAPGTPKSTTLPEPRTSRAVVAWGPFSPDVHTLTSGTRSPTAMAMPALLSLGPLGLSLDQVAAGGGQARHSASEPVSRRRVVASRAGPQVATPGAPPKLVR